jgi:glycosyltransferase involved in cell wall biosynthesis
MKDKKKIILITTSFGWGGTEGHVSNLAISLKNRNIDVIVLIDKPPLDRTSILEIHNIPYIVLSKNSSISIKDYENSLSQNIIKLEPDIVHINAWERRNSIMSVLNKLKIPFAETLHRTYPPQSSFWNLRNRFCINKSPIETFKHNYILRKSQPLVINISDISLLNYKKLYPFVKKTIRIYCGAFFPKEIPNNKNSNELTILWIGSMIERKRPLLAVNIWKEIQCAFPTAKLIMIGVGTQFELVKDIVEKCNCNVSILGAVPDLYPYLNEANIILNTSTNEGIPKNIIYSFNFGIPVISTNVGAISEILKDGIHGFLTDIDDKDKIKANLELLLINDILREKMGENAREQGRKLFNMENNIDEILNSYNKYLGVDLEPTPYCPDQTIPILD